MTTMNIYKVSFDVNEFGNTQEMQIAALTTWDAKETVKKVMKQESPTDRIFNIDARLIRR